MPEPVSQPNPDPYQHDLTPDMLAGVIDSALDPKIVSPRTAYDIKAINQSMSDLEDFELKQIPILPEGTRLKQGATYVDLHDPQRQEFTARANMVAGPDNWYAAKTEVPYPLWNYLIGVRDPARLDTTQQAIDEQ